MITAETKPVTIEKEYKFATQIFIFSVLFAITAIGVYLSFIVCDRTLLRNGEGNIDGIAQEYPLYIFIKHLLEDFFSGKGISEWSWDIGLGAAQMDYVKSRLLNPLTYFIVAFPEKYLDIGYSIATVMRQYFCGISFLVFARRVSLNQNQRLIGALCYTFSGWAVMATDTHGSFTNVMILLPLLILGIEKVIKKESPILFIISVFLFFTAGVIWAYAGGIIAILYYIVRYVFFSERKEARRPSLFFKDFMIFIGYGIVGVLISASVVITMVVSMTNATIDTQLDNYGVLYSIKTYLAIPAKLVSYNFVHSTGSAIYLPIICIMLIPFIIKNIRKNIASVFAVGLFIAGLFPFTGEFFNGMSYSVGRWYFLIAFFAVWAAMECLETAFKSKRNIRIMAIWLIIIGVWNIAICYVVLDIISVNAVYATIVGFVFGEVILALFYIKEIRQGLNCLQIRSAFKPTMNLLIILVLLGSIIGAANMRYYPGLSDLLYSFEKVGSIENKFSGSTQRVAVKLESEEKGFFRTDQVDGYNDERVARMIVNENIYWGYRSIYSYFSTISSKWLEYNKTMGNNCGYFDRTISFSNDNRAALDYLMGVKYFLGDSENKREGASKYAPYGFSYYKNIEGVDVYKNKYNLGLGGVYNRYITESELMEYSPLEREQIIMQAIVIPDNYKNKIGEIQHAKPNELSTDIREIKCQIKGEDNVRIKQNLGKLTVYKGGGNISIKLPEIRNSQIFVSFENLIREKNDFEKHLDLSAKSIEDVPGNYLYKSVKKASYEDDEMFKIYAQIGDVEKAAINNKGKNQGFNNIKDYNINLGYYDSIKGDVDIQISNEGYYTFDAIKIYAVPMDIYDKNARLLESQRYNVTDFGNDYVEGEVKTKTDGVLYLSIPCATGWKIYVDGEQTDKIENVNIAFAGIRLSPGQHKVVLKYTYPLRAVSWLFTAIGIVILIIIALYRKRLKK